MNINTANQLTELYQNYLELGGDLLMLGAVAQLEDAFVPNECVQLCLERMEDYIEQHISDITGLSRSISRAAAPYFPRMAEK